MAITIQDIDYLSELSRLHVSEEAKENLASQISEIIDYVSQITDVNSSPDTNMTHINVLREDIVTNMPKSKTEALLSEAPSREGDYVKVAKVL